MSNPKSRSQKQANDEFIENVWRLFTFTAAVIGEIAKGISEFRIPFFITVGATLFVRVALINHWDYTYLIQSSNFEWLYPVKPALRNLYYYAVLFAPALVWGGIRVVTKRRYRSEVDTMFQACGVTNRVGQTPKPVQSFTRNDGTKVLRVSAKGISVDDFKKSKPQLEQTLRAHVDGFEANLREGTIDIKYSKEGMAEEFPIDGDDLDSLRPSEFIVGKNKNHLLRVELDAVPHLLIAGETGGGKSTFLRQFITGLYLNDSVALFSLIDLKGGLEFHSFKGLPRLRVMTDLDTAITGILGLESELDRRFRLIESKQCRDLESYNRKVDSKRQLARSIVIVDEVAELFLTGSVRSDGGLDKARALLNRIARQGRAVGIHLVVATQRPDSRSLDSQIKANLTGALCFAMVNDASSINVLGNGKATELPHVKGRALWKVGASMTEVQTPYLDEREASQLLARYRQTATTLKTPSEMRGNDSNRFRPLK